jgi:type IX secretion system PorP/SprF family membrane protein
MMNYRLRSKTRRILLISRIFIILLLLCMEQRSVKAQDVHFSQFFSAPLLVNPANTGMSGGFPRVAANYRNQWSKTGIPFRTTYISMDGGLPVTGNRISLGGALIHDKASAYKLTADEILFSVSYSVITHNQQFTIGIQPAIVFKSLNYDYLTFSSQFDGTDNVFNTNFPSGENLSGNLHHFDLGAGIYWRTLIHAIMPSAGISVRHMNRPTESFASSIADSRLPMKFTFHGQIEIPLNTRLGITPSILYGYTPGAYEWLAGSTAAYKFLTPAVPVRNISALAMVRLNPWRNADAVILGVGLQLRRVDLGFSYDINVSPLARATSVRGSYEFYLTYRGNTKNTSNPNEPCRIY